jgi:hypothetical protein
MSEKKWNRHQIHEEAKAFILWSLKGLNIFRKANTLWRRWVKSQRYTEEVAREVKSEIVEMGFHLK